jgi:hypothetical protein
VDDIGADVQGEWEGNWLHRGSKRFLVSLEWDYMRGF